MSRPKDKGQFVQLPLKDLIALGMPSRLVPTYCAVLSYDWGQGAGCTASAQSIAERAGCGLRTTIRHLGHLADQGWIASKDQAGGVTVRTCRVRWDAERRAVLDERTEAEKARAVAGTPAKMAPLPAGEDNFTPPLPIWHPHPCQSGTPTPAKLAAEVDLGQVDLGQVDPANQVLGDPKPPRAGARSVDPGPTKGAQDGTGKKWPAWMPNGEWPKPGPVRPADPPVTGPWRTEGWRERLKAVSLSCRRGITPVGLYRLVVEKFGLERTLDAEAYVWQCSVDPDEPPSNCDFVDKLWFDAKDGMRWDEPHLLHRLDEEARQFVQSRPARTIAA